jgi:hypothetical protein
MQTIRLQVNESVYEKLMWLLSKFSKDELEIISEPAEFEKNRQYLVAEMEEILEGKAVFLDFEQAEKRLSQSDDGDENRI